MHLDIQYKRIVKAAVAPNDGSRPVLNCLHVKRTSETTGELAAADGFILAVVPCTLEPDDVPGLISQECLAAAFKAGTKYNGATMLLGATEVTVFGGAKFPRPEGQFPDYQRIVPAPSTTTTGPADLDPARLLQLLTALGLPSTGGALQANKATGPTIVHTTAPAKDGTPALPYGVIMPMNRPTSWFTRTDAPAAAAPADHNHCQAELASARDQITRQQQSIDTLQQQNAALIRQHDEREHLIAAGEATITGLREELQGWQETAAHLENERNAAQAAAPIAGGAIEQVGPLHARLAAQFYCECGAHYDEPCQCPDAALPVLAGSSEPMSAWAAWAASQPRWGSPAHALAVRGWAPMAGGSGELDPQPPTPPAADTCIPENMQRLPVAIGESYQRPHRHKCTGANDTGCGVAWECGPRCSDPRLWYRYCPTCEAQYRPDPQTPAEREAAQRADENEWQCAQCGAAVVTWGDQPCPECGAFRDCPAVTAYLATHAPIVCDQPECSVHHPPMLVVDELPQVPTYSSHPNGIMGAIVEYLDPELYAEKFPPVPAPTLAARVALALTGQLAPMGGGSDEATVGEPHRCHCCPALVPAPGYHCPEHRPFYCAFCGEHFTDTCACGPAEDDDEALPSQLSPDCRVSLHERCPRQSWRDFPCQCACHDECTLTTPAAPPSVEQERDAAQLQARANADTARINYARIEELQAEIDRLRALPSQLDRAVIRENAKLRGELERLTALAQAALTYADRWENGTDPEVGQARTSLFDAVAALDARPAAIPCNHPADAIRWNPYNQVTQCHRCGQVMPPPMAGGADDTVTYRTDLDWRHWYTPEQREQVLASIEEAAASYRAKHNALPTEPRCIACGHVQSDHEWMAGSAECGAWVNDKEGCACPRYSPPMAGGSDEAPITILDIGPDCRSTQHGYCDGRAVDRPCRCACHAACGCGIRPLHRHCATCQAPCAHDRQHCTGCDDAPPPLDPLLTAPETWQAVDAAWDGAIAAADLTRDAPLPMAGGAEEWSGEQPCRLCGSAPRMLFYYLCADCVQDAVERAHGATLAKAAGVCALCNDQPVDAPGMICYRCCLINSGRHPRIPSTPLPIAGGALSHYTSPDWEADEAWHLQEERNAADRAQEDADAINEMAADPSGYWRIVLQMARERAYEDRINGQPNGPAVQRLAALEAVAPKGVR